ncbi:MAG: class I SAM-dependent methyltransferase, partial [Myxococcales bacterium]|nr:class I SAM-dependent methyltransferase [Myxococcales bacterium]
MRDRRVARVIDREIAPIWHDRFARMILRNLPLRAGQFVLDMHSGPGHSTAELLQRLDDSSRVLAIEPDETLVEVAKTRVRPEWRNRVYFKGGHFEDIFGMAPATYDLVIANLVLGEGTELAPAVGELLRVTKPGGHILATLPLTGTWQEVEDIFAEVLRDAGLHQAVRRLERLRSLRPPASLLGDLLKALNCPRENYVIESEQLQMLFPSGREFLFAPVIEHGPLRLWKAIIGDDGSPQELFWRLKEAIDVYYAGHVLAVTVSAGLIHVQIPSEDDVGPSLAAHYWSRYPELDRLWGGLAASLTEGRQPVFAFSESDVDEFDLDLDIDLDGGGGFGEDEDEGGFEAEPEPAAPIQALAEDLDYQPYAYAGDEWNEGEEGAHTAPLHEPVEALAEEPEPEPEYEDDFAEEGEPAEEAEPEAEHGEDEYAEEAEEPEDELAEEPGLHPGLSDDDEDSFASLSDEEEEDDVDTGEIPGPAAAEEAAEEPEPEAEAAEEPEPEAEAAEE